jgi:hypothetical protein
VDAGRYSKRFDTAPKLPVDLTEPGKREECASCGSAGASRLVTEANEVLLCEGCADRLLAGEAIGRWLPDEVEPREPPEERFAEVFKAARTILKEDITEEDRIYPTLAFANELGQRVEIIEQKERLVSAWEDGSDAWTDAVGEFSRRWRSIRPVEVVDGVVLLERVPMSVRIDNYPIQDVEVPRVIVLTIYPHTKPPTLEEIAARYDSELTAADIPHAESKEGRFEFSSRGGHLLVEIHHRHTSIPQDYMGVVFRESKPRFPHPRLVGAFCEMLLGTSSKDGFVRFLVPRRRGPTPPPDTVIPASVAFYLRDYGGMKEGIEAHRLLNEHVLQTHRKRLPEGYSDSVSNKLWKDADKVRNHLLAAAHSIQRYDSE